MSLTPGAPNLGSQIATAGKSFWDRREGTTGKIVLVIGALAAAGILFTMWGVIVPFVLGTLTSTLYMGLDVLALMAITSPIWSQRVRLLCTTAFKLSMRWSTQLLIETDPIGILREHILTMKKMALTLVQAVEKVAKAVQGLTDAIDRNKQKIQDARGKIQSTNRIIADTQSQLSLIKDPSQAMITRTKINKLQLALQGYQQTIGIAADSITQEQGMLDKANVMYEQLLRYQNLSDFKISEFTQNADMLEERRKVILAGSEGLSAMQKLLGGDPVGQELIDRDIEFLNTEASDVMGAISNFNAYSDKYLTDMDIQNGAAAAKGADIFAALEAKLNTPLSLPDGQANDSMPINTVQDSTGAYVPVSAANDYSKFLK